MFNDDITTHTQLFLSLLSGEEFTFQSIDDKKKRPFLAKQIHSSFDDAKDKLIRLNMMNIGVFVTINQTDGKGRKKENITKVRALFADLDGSPIQPILQARLKPHMVIESSKGKYHAYWLVDNCSLDEFSSYQKAIAVKFGSDPVVCDLPRVMRLPGFYHCKGKPFPVKIKQLESCKPYSLNSIRNGLELKLEEGELTINDSTSNTLGSLDKGSRNDTIFRIACSLKGRGESFEKATNELLSLNQCAKPPLADSEVNCIVKNVWNRY